jgi:polyvinyl alcohol dehydrogenase (cytochrome)
MNMKFFRSAMLSILPWSLAIAGDGDGARLYQERCATCHDQSVERMPSRAALREFAPEYIITAITTGVMRVQGSGLSSEQMRALAEFLSAKPLGEAQATLPKENRCSKSPVALQLQGSQWNGWGNNIENTRVQPNPGLSAADLPRLKLKWAYAYPGRSTYGQPTLVGDRVFVTSVVGQVSALDVATGCAYWTYDAGAGVKTAVTIGAAPEGSDAKFVAYFGDERAYAHAIDADTGKPIWRTRLDLHASARITGSPTLYNGRLYVPVSSMEESLSANSKYECCTFRGSLSSLDASTGKPIWKTFTIDEEPRPFKKSRAGTQMFGPAGVAIWNSPTVDAKHEVIYVGTGNSYTEALTTTHDAVVAFDMKTGERKWAKVLTAKDSFNTGCMGGAKNNCPQDSGPDFDFGASIILKTLPNGKTILIAGQKSGVVYALDPDSKGKIIWQTAVGAGSALGGVEWGMAADNDQLYVAISDMLNLKSGVPGLTALRIRSGERAWYVATPPAMCSFKGGRCVRAQSAAVTAMPGAVFSGAFDGVMRAYSTVDGTQLWEFDTGQEFTTVNGITVSGGNIDGGGPTLANGRLVVNSGYGSWTGGFGRVMLVFEVPK